MTKRGCLISVGVGVLVFLAFTCGMGMAITEAQTHKTCDTYICVGKDDHKENRITVERIPGMWSASVWRIRTLRDTTEERFGGECRPLYCNYDDSQRGATRGWHYDYQCVGSESEIGVYVSYRVHGRVKTLPSDSGPTIHDTYMKSAKIPVSC